MSTEQLLTIGGIILFTLLTLSFNSSSINQSSSSNFNEAFIIAVGLGQSMIEEIRSKAFDENTISAPIDSTTNLTTANMLGYESGEGIIPYGQAKKYGYDQGTTFDDIDDYKGFSRDYADKLLDNFNIEVDVYYVNPSNPDNKSINRTFAKRIDITITNPYLTVNENDSNGTLKLTSIMTY